MKLAALTSKIDDHVTVTWPFSTVVIKTISPLNVVHYYFYNELHYLLKKKHNAEV